MGILKNVMCNIQYNMIKTLQNKSIKQSKWTATKANLIEGYAETVIFENEICKVVNFEYIGHSIKITVMKDVV